MQGLVLSSLIMSYVVVRLMGGLGNQMFQYAVGAAIAQHKGVPLFLDRGFLDARPKGMTWTPREFALDSLRAPIAFADATLTRRMRRALDTNWYPALHRLLPRSFPLLAHLEQGTGHDALIEQLEPPLYLEGYWQNEGYFQDIADQLRADWFLPRAEPGLANAGVIELIARGPCASLHVRRGDFVSHPQTSAYHGACDASYYQRAAEALIARSAIERFIVFSDDPEWSRASLRLPLPAEYVSHNTGKAAHWDMHLMSRCDHHIIANSSFSWWGAWLNPSRTKTAIAPKQWFQGADISVHDIIPDSWIAL